MYVNCLLILGHAIEQDCYGWNLIHPKGKNTAVQNVQTIRYSDKTSFDNTNVSVRLINTI